MNKVVTFPGKRTKDKGCDCDCRYMYRPFYCEESELYGVEIGLRHQGGDIEVLTTLQGFTEEVQAQAASFGFMEALHFMGYIESPNERA